MHEPGGDGAEEYRRDALVALRIRDRRVVCLAQGCKAEALAQAAALELYRGPETETAVEWTYLSPPPHPSSPASSVAATESPAAMLQSSTAAATAA